MTLNKVKPLTQVLAVFLFSPLSLYAQFTNDTLTTNTSHQGETAIACSPLNENYLIAAWIDDRTPATVHCSFSTDGGGTWAETEVRSGVRSVDPSVAFDRHGWTYFAYMNGSRALSVSRTSDLGSSWDETDDIATAVDKPYIAVDNTGGEFDGRVYVSWYDISSPNGPYSVLFAYSSDVNPAHTFVLSSRPLIEDSGGQLWSMPAVASNATCTSSPTEVPQVVISFADLKTAGRHSQTR